MTEISKGSVALIASGWTFAQVPILPILDRSLSPGAKELFVYMCWRRDQEGKMWPSVASIAQDLGISRPSVHKRINELVNEGYLCVFKRRGRTSVYSLTAKAIGNQGASSASSVANGDEPVKESLQGDVKKPLQPSGDLERNLYTNDMQSDNNMQCERDIPRESSLRAGDKAASPPPNGENDTPPHKVYFSALAQICNLDPNVNRGRINRAAKRYRDAGYDVELMTRLFGPGGWWYTHWWQGKNGQPPNPEDIGKHWLNAQKMIGVEGNAGSSSQALKSSLEVIRRYLGREGDTINGCAKRLEG